MNNINGFGGSRKFRKIKIEVEKCTHKQLSSELQQCYPREKGFSVRSIKRFCSEKEIKKVASILIITVVTHSYIQESNIDGQTLDEFVSTAVLQV